MKTPPGRLFVKMGEDNAFNSAVVIAWNFLQSLFPIALVMAAVLGVGLVGPPPRQLSPHGHWLAA